MAPSRETTTSPSTPSAFGRYRVVHQVGAGVLGPVFRGYDPDADRAVAIKSFPLDLTPEQAGEFAAELGRVAALGVAHPSLIAPLASGLAGSVAYLVQEYFVAESLDVALKQYGPAPVPDALRLIGQLAAALDHAAASGLHHGALHPRDVLVAPHEVRLTGLGVAGALEKAGYRPAARLPYAAPERVDGGECSLKSDVYSLAAIGYELLTGRRPAVGGGAATADTTSIEAADAAALVEVFARALSGRSADRYPSALAFAAALKHALTGEPLQSGGDSPRPRARRAPKAAAAAASLPLDASVAVEPPAVGVGEVVAVAPADVVPAPEPARLAEAPAEAVSEVERAELAEAPVEVEGAKTAEAVSEVEEPGEAEALAEVEEAVVPEAAATFGPATPQEPEAPAATPVAAGTATAVEPVRVDETQGDLPAPVELDAGHTPLPVFLEPYRAAAAALADEVVEPVPPAPDVPPAPPERSADPDLFALDQPSEAEPVPPPAPAGSILPDDLVLAPPLGFEIDVPTARVAPPPVVPVVEPELDRGFEPAAVYVPAAEQVPEPGAEPELQHTVRVPESFQPPAEAESPARVQEVSSVLPQSPVEPGPRVPLGMAAAMLALGILIGFVGGFSLARRGQPAPAQAQGPAAAGAQVPAPAPPQPDVYLPPPPPPPPEPTPAPKAAPKKKAPAPVPAKPAAKPAPGKATTAKPTTTPSTSAKAAAPSTSLGASKPGQFEGSLAILSRPAGARVMLDGRAVGTTPLTLKAVSAGSHVVRIELDGYTAWSSSVQVSAGKQARVAASLERPPDK